jgi:hypothetical protein
VSRPVKGKLKLTFEELLYINRAIERYGSSLKKNPRSSPRMADAVSVFQEKVIAAMAGDKEAIILPLNRNELRILQGIAEVEHATLVAKVIPGYGDRIRQKGPELYQPYLDTAIKRADMLNNLRNKVRASL